MNTCKFPESSIRKLTNLTNQNSLRKINQIQH